jgi:hypothetical protein
MRPLTRSFLILTVAALLFPPAAFASSASFPGWSGFWSRDAGAGAVALDNDVPGGKGAVIRIEHKGQKDWSLNRADRIKVAPGDIFELTARVKVQGEGDVVLCAETLDPSGKVTDYSFGEVSARAAADWQALRSRVVIPPKVAEILPRVIGNGPATIWLDSFSVAKVGNIQSLRDPKMPAEISIGNKSLAVTLHTADATLSVLDRRTQKTWNQQPLRAGLTITSAKSAGNTIAYDWLQTATGLEGKATLVLDGDLPECVLALSAEGKLARPLLFPHPFTAQPPAYLVVPMNEGISYPVDDASIQPFSLVAYGGHGICMAFFGVTDGAAGQMAILETPDDASIRIDRVEGRLAIAPEWQSQKGRFGYERRLRYVFLDQGGHVAMCKRYRAYVQKTGLFKSLADKRREIPNVDLLLGAVNVWCWDRDAPAIARDLQAAGIERILWSNAQPPENLKALNEMPGVLTSRYDIYQDVMNPDSFKLLRGTHPDWTTAAWPKDLMIGANGDWVRGWQVRARDGSMIPCGVLCDRQAVAYAEKRIPEEMKTRPYRCRFIDTTTASPWRECYGPDHPMTRSDSRHYKMELLRYVSETMKLVCGSETGHDASVPYVHYFEGMLSLGPYRVPDAGRDMRRIWDEVPERVAKFQLGQNYRLPLWELVYHDCVVAQWYWGDYNNKLPALWDKRDLFNALYGTPPMFMFDRKLWEANKNRFVASYKATCPVARATGYAEMTDHRFLTPDRSVQQTAFANGVTVTANFGDAPYRLSDGTEIAPKKSRVTGVQP